jgi:predicted nucleic-acid-binding protein
MSFSQLASYRHPVWGPSAYRTWIARSPKAQAVVEAFDTNVVVRLLVRDDEEQYQRAELVLRRVTAGPGAWLSSVVLGEVAWVLRGAYEFDRATIAAALDRLIAIDGVHVEDGATMRVALITCAERMLRPTSVAKHSFVHSSDVSVGARRQWPAPFQDGIVRR